MKVVVRSTAVLCALATLLPAAPAAADQHEAMPMPIVWVNFLQAQPGQSNGLTAMLIEQGTKSYASLVASGAVLNWGVAMNVVHDGNDPASHVEWVSFANWAALDEFMAGFMAAMQSMTPEEQAASDERWAAHVVDGSHADVINQSMAIGGNFGSRPSYIHLSYYQARPGKEGDAMAMWKAHVGPAFQALADDGKILAYGLHVPLVHRNYDWTHMGWFSSTGLAARAAVDGSLGSPSPEMAAKMGEIFTDRHEDQILMVVHFEDAATAAAGSE